jgi:hypothetical protein
VFSIVFEAGTIVRLEGENNINKIIAGDRLENVRNLSR